MEAVAVSALHDQKINVAVLFRERHHRVPQDRFAEPPDVAGETDRLGLSVAARLNHTDGRTQNVSGIVKGTGHSFANGDGVAVGVAVEKSQGGLGVRHGVERGHRFQAVNPDHFVDVLDIELVPVFFEKFADLAATAARMSFAGAGVLYLG